MRDKKSNSRSEFLFKRNNLLNSKCSQAGVITTVLIILLVLAAVVIVWGVVRSTVKKGSENIGTSTFTTRLEIKEAKLLITGGAEVKVKKVSGDDEMTGLNFIFEKPNGETEIIEKTDNLPGKLETKIYNFNATDIDFKAKKISVVPVFGSNTGMEVVEDNPSEDNVDSASNLISWWKFDETSGTTAQDSVSNNNGVLNGDAYFDNGELILDGDGDYVSVLHNSNLNPDSGDFAISAWIKPNIVSGIQRFIYKVHPTDSPINGYYFMLSDSSVFFNIGDGTVQADASSGGTAVIGNWHFVTVVRDTTLGEIILYLDTMEINRRADPTGNLNDNTDLTIGARPGLIEPFDGSMDNVMIFDKALSEDEIRAIYNNQVK